MRGGLSGILSGSLPKAVVREGIAQAGMPVADYAGETVGTTVGFDPKEAADRAAAGLVAGVPLGAGAHLGVRGVRALREVYATKGVDTSGMSDEALTEGTLNGSIHPDVGPADVDAILQSAGSSAAHFSTPERAAQAAGRVRTVRPEQPSQLERELAVTEQTESHGDPNAVSPKGARGSMQTMPDTLRDPGYGVKPAQNDSPEEMRRVGRDYYTALRKHYGSAAKAWAAYNAGPGALDGAIAKYGDDWLAHMPEETRNYVRKNVADLGGEAPVYRAPAPTDDVFRSDSGFERTDAAQSPTEAELNEPGARYSRTATGDSSSPFMDAMDDPEGHPGFWERRSEMQAEDLRKEWEASRREPPPASEDPAAKYGANNYGQRPHADVRGNFATTDDGHIADVNGKPVAFRTVRSAAQFAAKNKLGGDFEPRVWAANGTRVVLTRRPGSAYGERPARPEGPAEPAAGRSEDTSQRLIPDWMRAPLASETASGGAKNGLPGGEPQAGRPAVASEAEPRETAPNLRAERGSEIDLSVPRETENVPAGPERFDEAPPLTDGDFYQGGTFERPRPEPAPAGEAPRPRNFLQAVVNQLNDRSRKSGLRHRIDAEDAINHGVDADAIYVNPKAKYPTVKAHLQRVFSSPKAPLRSKAQPVKLHALDDLGDRFDYRNFGSEHGDRPEPAEIGRLLSDSIRGHEDAFDRSDPNYDRRQEWIARHNAAMEFESRYGDRWAEMPDEELDRIDAEDAGPIDYLWDHVLGEGDERPAETEARDARPAGEDEGGSGRSERGSDEAGGRGPAAEDALFPERESDQRDALQRRADEPLKPDAEQKPAGSDGGLFDTQDTTGDLYGAKNKFVTREKKEAASRKISDASKRAHSGVDPEAVGAMATEAAFHVEASARKVASMMLEPDADPGEIIRAARDMVKSPAKTTKGLLKALDRFGSAVAYSSDGALRTLARHYKSPEIVRLADMFQARAGKDDATGRTYDEALKRQNGRFRSRLDAALDPFIGSKPAMERIRDLLADPDRTVRSTEKERAAAREIRDLLKDVIDYRKEAGEDIGEVKNYFPRVLDSLAVANDAGKFKAAAERLYRGLGVDDPRAAAEAWLTRVLDTHAGLDGGEEFVVSSGKPSSSKSREFGAEADRELRDFLQKDPLLVLSDYITGSVRRAEQTRRFGAKGAVNSAERGAWMKEHGTKTQWDVMVDKIRDEVRASGEDADGVIRAIHRIRDGNLGRLGTAGVRVSRAVSTIHAWNQLSTLQKVTLSSIGDLAMGFVRAGPTYGVRHLTTSLREAARLVETFGKRDLSDGHRWAEAMGTVGHGTASQLIQARMDAAPGAIQHASLLNKFYHKVGIEQLTQGGRIAATNNAKVFLDTLSGDLLSKSARTRQRATLYLKELGIKDPQAFGEWLRKGPPSSAELAADRGHAADYATAVVRFADQTILMPSRAMKPAWANHPVGSLFFALQSYNAAFTQNVLKRTGRLAIQGVKSKDPALLIPASGLVVLVAMNALQLYLRTNLFGGKQPDDAEAFALQAMDRAGLTGMASPIFNAFLGLKYHRSVSQSLQGAVVGRVAQGIDAAGGLAIGNSKKTNTAERNAAGLLYDLGIDPAINAFGAKYLRGAAGTATILGTGNREGGALPGDRDAFIDAVAGREKKRVSSGE
jgi:hypothetical protein